jgi:hypothetical protein
MLQYSKFAEVWIPRIKEMVNNGVNFSAFDMDTIKNSLVNYVKLYYPESFNDLIESSEFIALLDIFAYVGELYAYRIDMSAPENFIGTAQRKDSVITLANFLTYNPSRNMPARGLVKLRSIVTTSPVLDPYGNNLSNVVINWNDPTNPIWKEQFLLVMNDILAQPFGYVLPQNRVQVENTLFERYEFNNNYLKNGVIPFSISVGGSQFPMEMVSCGLNSYGPYELTPSVNQPFSILYGTDGLGDQSAGTGFFIFAKQGTLSSITTTFNSPAPNQTFDLLVSNINQTDIWLNLIDINTGATITEWTPVPSVFEQNLFFNTVDTPTKYQVQTLSNDNARLLFGDGIFADLPEGNFQIWYRVSANSNTVLSQSAMSSVNGQLTYQNLSGITQNFQFTASATTSFDNGSTSETIEHIRNTAPSLYVTQNRMVNGPDYSIFLTQEPSVLKSTALNRTYSGASRYITWSDPSGGFEHLKLFGDDLAIFIRQGSASFTVNNIIDVSTLINGYVLGVLGGTDILFTLLLSGIPYYSISNNLSSVAISTLASILTPPPQFATAYGYFSPSTSSWQFTQNLVTGSSELIGPLISVVQSASNYQTWTVTYQTTRLIVDSPNTNFWNANNASSVLDLSTLQATYDSVQILQANVNGTGTNILDSNLIYQVLSTDTINPTLGGTETQLSVFPLEEYYSTNNYLIQLGTILNSVMTIHSSAVLPTQPTIITLPDYYLVTSNTMTDVRVTGNINNSISWTQDPNTPIGQPSNVIVINSVGTNTTITVTVSKYVYYYRTTINDPYILQPYTLATMQSYSTSVTTTSSNLWTRYQGRQGLNFIWEHIPENMNLIDPAPTNIIDIVLITSSYYSSFLMWLQGERLNPPTPPTPSQLYNSYGNLLSQKMISDTAVLRSGQFKIIFGPYADSKNQCVFNVIASPNSNTNANVIANSIVSLIQTYFDINNWNFGQSFYFNQLSTYICSNNPDVLSIVIIPTYPTSTFGSLFQINADYGEILIPHINADMIKFVKNYNPTNLKQL